MIRMKNLWDIEDDGFVSFHNKDGKLSPISEYRNFLKEYSAKAFEFENPVEEYFGMIYVSSEDIKGFFYFYTYERAEEKMKRLNKKDYVKTNSAIDYLQNVCDNKVLFHTTKD